MYVHAMHHSAYARPCNFSPLWRADPARPFDFIINGELVRKSLEKHLLAHEISAEAVVEVEYVPAVAPPEPKNAIPHDDW